jgi:hypothetical protein
MVCYSGDRRLCVHGRSSTNALSPSPNPPSHRRLRLGDRSESVLAIVECVIAGPEGLRASWKHPIPTHPYLPHSWSFAPASAVRRTTRLSDRPPRRTSIRIDTQNSRGASETLARTLLREHISGRRGRRRPSTLPLSVADRQHSAECRRVSLEKKLWMLDMLGLTGFNRYSVVRTTSYPSREHASTTNGRWHTTNATRAEPERARTS